MILGTGIDIVDIKRIDDAYKKFGDNFAKKILFDSEFDEYNNIKIKYKNDYNKIISFLAKHWAVKEAVSKSVGCGLINGSPLHFKDLILTHNNLNAPNIVITDNLKYIIEKIYNVKDFNSNTAKIHISTSSDSDFIVASAILELRNKWD